MPARPIGLLPGHHDLPQPPFMTDSGSWHVIFDVSERIPSVFLGWLALAVLGAVVLGLAGRQTRASVLRSWWVVSLAGILLLATRSIRESDWWFLGFALLFGAVAMVSEVTGQKFRWSPRLGGQEAPAGTIAVIAGGALLTMAGLFGVSQSAAVGLAERLATGDTTVVVGRVTGYSAGPSGKWDCFSVEGHQFCFSDYVMQAGFNRTQFFGSPLRNGSLVRLNVVGETIVRLELPASPDRPAPPQRWHPRQYDVMKPPARTSVIRVPHRGQG